MNFEKKFIEDNIDPKDIKNDGTNYVFYMKEKEPDEGKLANFK